MAQDPAATPETGRTHPGGAPAALVAAAEEAVAMSGADPGRARARARAVLAEAESAGCAEAVSVAHRALALVAREFGDLAHAAHHLDLAVTSAAALPERAAQARLSLVAVRAHRGDPVGALRVADLAEGHLTGLDRDRLAVQRAVALIQLGRAVEAVAHCDRAIDVLTGAGDPRFLGGALLNRGIAHTYLERYDAAHRDLSACRSLAEGAGLDHLAVLAEANLAFVATRLGDIPAAFAWFQSADRALAGYPERLAAMRVDFAGALLAAHLPGEARALLTQAVPELAASEARVALAESRLLLAQLELLVGDPYQARTYGELAAQELAAQERHAWLPLAAEVVLRARLAVEPPSPRLLDELRTLADRLSGEGWAGPASGLRLTAAELALTLRERAAAETELGRIAAGEPSGRAHRVVRHHAIALRRDLHGDRPGALAALREGLAAATAGTERLADPGVRAHAVRAGGRLAEFGLSLALADGRPEAVLDWSEHCRTLARGHLETEAPATEPGDAARPAERPRTGPGGPVTARRLRAALGDAVLVELVRHGDRLAAVVATADRCVLRPLGSYTGATEAAIRLRHGMRRAGLGDTTAGRGAATEGEWLARHLLGPLARDIGDRPAIVVPAGALHSLPWPVLPPFQGRPLCVAPSATAWMAAATRRPVTSGCPGGCVVAVAGPGLRHADAEATMVVRVHERGGRGIQGDAPADDAVPAHAGEAVPARAGAVRVRARAGDVLRALGRAEVVHVAAHGFFCGRSPLLSSIGLDDGPLMAYDLIRLRRAPWLVVLSACEAGMAHAPVDGAPLGLAGAFLEQGSACVVAGLVPVRDDEALTLMTAFHTLLVSGRTPAEALAMAGEKTGVAGFACFGSLGHRIGRTGA